MITDRNLKPTTLLKAEYKKATYLAEIKSYQDEKNLTLEILEGSTELAGRQFSSLSKAAMAITGNSVNGWRFWTVAAEAHGKVKPEDVVSRIDDILTEPKPTVTRVEGAVDLSGPEPAPEQLAGVDLPTAAQDAGFGNGGAFTADAKRKSKPKVFNPIKRTAQQGGLEEGETRMWCAGCMASFKTELAPDAFKADEATCPNGHNVGEMREAAAGQAVVDAVAFG